MGFINEGKVLVFDFEVYNNVGNSYDFFLFVFERVMFYLDNVYEIFNIRINGRVCFIYFSSNIVFRGFGGF